MSDFPQIDENYLYYRPDGQNYTCCVCEKSDAKGRLCFKSNMLTISNKKDWYDQEFLFNLVVKNANKAGKSHAGHGWLFYNAHDEKQTVWHVCSVECVNRFIREYPEIITLALAIK